MSNEERPRLSLRLHGLSATPAETPPDAPPAPDTPPQPSAADTSAATPATPSLQLRRPRLNNLLAPTAEPAPASEPSALSALSAAPAPEPAPMPEAVPEPPTELVPPPLPAIAFDPPPPIPTVRPAGAPPIKPPVKPAHFPPPPGYGKPSERAAQPQSAATAKPKAGLTLLILLGLVIGGAAYVYFADPLGLFAHAQASEPAATPPPVAEAPAPETQPEPVAAEPEPTPEPPAEIVPEEPPPPPPPLPEIVNAIAALKVSGARMNSSGGIIMLGTKVHNAGDVINAELGITFVGFSEGTFTFRDDRGATYQRRF